MDVFITLTTIRVPQVIESYIRNGLDFGHRDVALLVVGDRKTPAEAAEYCRRTAATYGVTVRYLDLDFQRDYLRRFPALERHLPFDSFARRNVGDLLAYEEGARVVIRVDDDNAPLAEDFIGQHAAHGEESRVVLASEDGWFNICRELVERDNIPFYPRGYPYSRRWKDGRITRTERRLPTALNAGLWLGDPDVDAITRLTKPIDAVDYRGTYGRQFVLDRGTWSPIDTQNTSYLRRLLPASFVSPHVGRYDDIWSGYLLRAIMDHLGDFVSFGRPLLRQDRNPHNLWRDLDAEMNGNLHTDHLVAALREIRLTKTDYAGCYQELGEKLRDRLTENRAVFLKLIDGMFAWVEAIARVTPN
jgi:hypothetical protein